jgi:hypothetical protein
MAPRLASHAVAFSSPATFSEKPVYLIEVYARQFDHEQREGRRHVVDRLSKNHHVRGTLRRHDAMFG